MANCWASSLSRTTLGLLILILPVRTFAQQAKQSPLGALIAPASKLRVSRQLRSILPANAVVRLAKDTHILGDVEQVPDVIVAHTEHPCKTEVYNFLAVPHDANVRTRLKLIAGLIHHTYTLFGSMDLRDVTGENAFVTAFRNIGDGAGTIFLVVASHDDKYLLALKALTTQGRFKVLPGGQVELWDADDGGECVWCPHVYTATTLIWKSGKLVRIRSHHTKHKIDPAQMANVPITGRY